MIENCSIGQKEKCEQVGCQWMRAYGEPCSKSGTDFVYDTCKKAKPKQAKGVKRLRIFKRDRGICYLCLQPVTDYENEATLDHVIPRSRGGGNTMENLRLAHKVCNIWKDDSLLEDLDLEALRQHRKPAVEVPSPLEEPSSHYQDWLLQSTRGPMTNAQVEFAKYLFKEESLKHLRTTGSFENIFRSIRDYVKENKL
jgi:5-methylcytosine-specific restriction endonuclease McrA